MNGAAFAGPAVASALKLAVLMNPTPLRSSSI